MVHAVNSPEFHWFDVSLQGDWSHHLIKSLLHEVKPRVAKM